MSDCRFATGQVVVRFAPWQVPAIVGAPLSLQGEEDEQEVAVEASSQQQNVAAEKTGARKRREKRARSSADASSSDPSASSSRPLNGFKVMNCLCLQGDVCHLFCPSPNKFKTGQF